MIGGQPYYTSKTALELPDIETITNDLPPKLQTTIYLKKVTQALDGPERLKYIRLAIQATPKNTKSYDILYNFVENIPIDFGIPGYLSQLYAYPDANQGKIADITHHRFEMFNEPERQQRFLEGLSSELREALSKLKPKSLKELKTQIRRNE